VEDVVIYKKEEAIGKIIINRPQKRNALDLNTLKKLTDAFKQSEENKDLCVIFTAEGKDWSVGADLKYGYSLMTRTDAFQEALEYAKSWQDLTRAMRNHSGILIAGLKGYVIGGASEMTLSCDLRVASKDMILMMPELSLGTMFSNASTKLLPNLIGEAKAKELIFLRDGITAEEAYQMGFVNSVVEPENLMKELDRIAQKIVEKEPLSLRVAKKLINENQDADINTTLETELSAMIMCNVSEGFRERLKAFVEERKH